MNKDQAVAIGLRAVKILGLAFFYSLAGKLALLLAIPPGYATAVWPASGIALAGCLMLGPGVWPGVFIGSFLTNLTMSFEVVDASAVFRSMALPTVIATGAVIQALAGACLVKRFAGWPSSPLQATQLLKTMLIAGPLASITNATIGNLGLLLTQEIESSKLTNSWVIWWLGDTLGVLVVLPLAAVWAAESPRASPRTRILISLPLGLCCLITTLAFLGVRDAEIEAARTNFVRQAEMMARSIEETVELKIDIVHSLVALFEMNREVTRREFQHFVKHTFSRHPDLHGLSWNVVADSQGLDRLERRAVEDGFLDFRVTEQNKEGKLVKAGKRPEYVVVYYIEPYLGNEAALGYDLKSDAVRAKALGLAHRTRSLVSTPPITLVQGEKRQTGFLFFAPIYGSKPPGFVGADSRSPQSYVSAVFRAKPFVEAILRPFSQLGISCKIRYSSASAETAVMYPEQVIPIVAPSFDMAFSKELQVGGKIWHLDFWPNTHYRNREFPGAWSMLTGGLFLTSLLGILLCVLAGRTAMTEQAVVIRTAALRRSNRTLRRQIRQREIAEQALQSIREELELRVEQRTADLVRANEDLRAEIREREKAEYDLISSEKRFRAIFDAPTIGIAIADSEGLFLEVNDYVHKMLGYEEDGLVGKSFADICAEEHLEATVSDLRKLREEGKTTLQGEHAFKRKDSGSVWALVRSTAIFQGSRLQYFLSVIEDVTIRKRIEEELSKAEKLDSIGVLAGGIAHDFNNLLTAVFGNLELARSEATLAGRAYITEALLAARQAAQLTRQLLTFSKGGAPVTRPVNLLELVEECAAFALRGSKSRVDFKLSGDIWAASVDTSQISQVISNLIINADQAMPQGGRITVGMKNFQVEAHHGLMVEPGRFIEISIQDEGVGIAPENRSRIFDPYFTTKKRGSGLGLATAYSIVKRHQGQIAVESSPGTGTTFQIYLPATTESVDEGAVENPEPINDRDARVLIMDDEVGVRQMLARFLRGLGYETEVAPNGEEAIRLYQAALARQNPFDVVILDLTVPGGMGGRETIAELRRLGKVRALVSSGYSEDQVLSKYREYGFSGTVRKPYSLTKVGRAIQNLLDKQN